MPNAYKNAGAAQVTAATTVYAAPAQTTALVQLLHVANTSGAPVTFTAQWRSARTATTTTLTLNAPLAAAASVSVTDRTLILEAGDTLIVAASGPVDVTVSVLSTPA